MSLDLSEGNIIRILKLNRVLNLIPLSFMPSEIQLVIPFPQMLLKLKQLRINTTMIFEKYLKLQCLETIAILRGFSNSTNCINPQWLHSYNNLLFPRAQRLYQYLNG